MSAIHSLVTASSYADAVQNPAHYFKVPELQGLTPRYAVLGPVMSTGANAVVFRVTIGGREHTLRCFTNANVESRERYVELGRHLGAHRLPFVAGTRWIEDAVTIGGSTRPVIVMDWIEGRTLDSYVGHLVSAQPSSLETLAQRWRTMMVDLAGGAMAHGDLQHGNVMIDEASNMRLVDLDAVWIPALAAQPAPNEIGHRNYQHPGRARAGGWNQWMDAFPAFVIYTSLSALAVEPRLWDEFHNGDNLIFVDTDFTRPAATPIWQRISALRSPKLDRLLTVLGECAVPMWNEAVSHEQLVLRATAPGTPGPSAWWTATGGPDAPLAPAAPAGLPWPMVVPAPSLPPPPKIAPIAPPPPVAVKVPTPPQANSSSGWWPGAPSAPVQPHIAPPGVPAKKSQSEHTAAIVATVLIVLFVLLIIGALSS